MLDLHLHSCFSDGTDTPAELIHQAVRNGIQAVALTDHDTMAGVPEFLAAARDIPAIQAIPGIELTCCWYNTSIHLTGLFLDSENKALQQALARQSSRRHERNLSIIGKLRRMDIPISYKNILATAGNGTVGRVHIARQLVDIGECESLEEAFLRYLGKGKSAYMNYFRPKPQEAAALICNAGGIAIWAHPGGGAALPPLSRLRQKARKLKEAGVQGIEVWYPSCPPGAYSSLLSLAKEFDFLPSGGTDYHGKNRPQIQLGIGAGNLRVPTKILSQLSAAARRNTKRHHSPDTPNT